MALDVEAEGFPRYFFFRACSTYVSTFRALAANHIRKQSLQKLSVAGKGLIFAMSPKPQPEPKTEQQETRDQARHSRPWIWNARRECSLIEAAASEIKWQIHERPSPQAVQIGCSEAPFLHFVCHGVTNLNDSMKSRLRLWNDREEAEEHFTVSYIFEWAHNPAYVAFLSSCSSADVADRTLIEENLDICNTLNLAGVCDVVGSIWPVSTKVGEKVADLFWQLYDKLLSVPPNDECSFGFVVRALNLALMLTALEVGMYEPLKWAGFIHVGGP